MSWLTFYIYLIRQLMFCYLTSSITQMTSSRASWRLRSTAIAVSKRWRPAEDQRYPGSRASRRTSSATADSASQNTALSTRTEASTTTTVQWTTNKTTGFRTTVGQRCYRHFSRMRRLLVRGKWGCRALISFCAMLTNNTRSSLVAHLSRTKRLCELYWAVVKFANSARW